LKRKLCTLKVVGIPTVEISGTKSHLDVDPVESCRVYYMGEGGGFPRIRVVVSLVNPKSPVALESELTNLWLVGCKFE
jgi:hypothetical protein